MVLAAGVASCGGDSRVVDGDSPSSWAPPLGLTVAAGREVGDAEAYGVAVASARGFGDALLAGGRGDTVVVGDAL